MSYRDFSKYPLTIVTNEDPSPGPTDPLSSGFLLLSKEKTTGNPTIKLHYGVSV